MTKVSPSESPIPSFPVDDLVPRSETQALEFVKTFPEYDGRNVTIGILDTGIDPAADGLNPIHVVDCTGSGDVSVEEERLADLVDGLWQVEGLTGRKLKLPGTWKLSPFPPSSGADSLGKEKKSVESKQNQSESLTSSDPSKRPVRLGVLRGYHLFPKQLKPRIMEHRRKELQNALSPYIVKTQQKLAQLKCISKPSLEQINEKQDLEARLCFLQDKHEDPGPLYDCVVFYDGSTYRAALSDSGDFTDKKPLASYLLEREYSTFGTIDLLNYAVNFYDDAKILSVVSDAGAHASHVGGIAAHKQHGVAPGAQLISFKIGDSRLGSMETGAALIRAMLAAIRLKVDVINLSYGEGSALPDRGRFVEIARDLVFKHNIIFCASAGNNGPALSSVGTPGGTSTPCWGIAAYVSSAMREANYSMILEGHETGATYHWSSVGPAFDGDFGVNLTAPGGAITSVPTWRLQKSDLMNGTSMSSPHATGCVALLLSACKAEGIPITPSRILKALQNTALDVEGLNTLQQGAGIIQVLKAWDYLKAHKDCETEDLHFEVCVDNRPGSPRGVYLRQPDECSAKHSFSINVDPQYRKDDVSEETQKAKCNLEIKFRLESTESWVGTPDFFLLMHNGRSFKIDVDPRKLDTGVHTARVNAYDTDWPDRGVVFSVPVTVAKPLKESADVELGDLEFQPVECKRFFLAVPTGATWMDVTITDIREDESDVSSRNIIVHSLQMLPHAAYRDAEVRKNYGFSPNETKIVSIPLHGGFTCELVCARSWNTLGPTKINVSVRFRGVCPTPNSIQLSAGGEGSCVRLLSELRTENINPTAKLTKWRTPLRPKPDGGFIVSPLPDNRDVIPFTNKQIFQAILTFEFTQETSGSITPIAPFLQGYLYESAFESQMMLIFDGNKKYLGVADAWPDEVRVPKGNITIRLQVRHDDISKLEKLKNLVIWIERKLEKDISLSIYTSRENLMLGGESFKKRPLYKGASCSVFLSGPPTSRLPKEYKSGDTLTGFVTFEAGESSLPGEGKRPGGFPLSYILASKPPNNKDTNTSDDIDERSPQEKLDEVVRDTKVDFLGKLTAKDKKDGKFMELYEPMLQQYQKHIPLLLEGLKYHDDEETRKNHLGKVVEAADMVIAAISHEEIALHFGKNQDKDDPKAVKERKEMTKTRNILSEAWARKARALADMDKGEEFESAFIELKKWIFEKEERYSVVMLERDRRAGRYGVMLKSLNALIGKEVKGAISPLSKADLLTMRAEVLEVLGYKELVEYDKARRVIDSPKSYRLF